MIENYVRNSNPKGIIHIGASIGQEIPFYESLKIPILYFEPLIKPFTQLIENIEKLPLFKAENVAIGEHEGEIPFYESSKGGVSSSPLIPTKHYEYFPERIFTEIKCKQITLDGYFEKNEMIYDVLVLDVQGYEKFVLNGAKKTLEKMNIVISEVWFEQLYENSALKKDIDIYLNDFGFREVVKEDMSELFANILYKRIK